MIHRYSRRVSLSDTDALGVVWHGHYLRYLEEARTELAREFDLTPRVLLEGGWIPMVIDYQIKCLRPVRSEALIWVESVVEVPETALLLFHSRIVAEAGEVCLRGQVRMAVQHRERGLLYRWPAELRGRIRRLQAAHGGDSETVR